MDMRGTEKVEATDLTYVAVKDERWGGTGETPARLSSR